MKNILYINNGLYSHNRDIYIDFIDSFIAKSYNHQKRGLELK
jgi:hypothetical protein